MSDLNDNEPLLNTKKEKFKAEKHRHIGALSVLTDILGQIKYTTIGQKLTSILLIFSCFGIFGLKLLAIVFLWFKPEHTEITSKMHSVLMTSILFINEILRFYEIEVVSVPNFYSLNIYFLAFADWCQLYFLHNLIILGAIKYITSSSDGILIGLFVLIITEFEHFFVQKYFSNESDISGEVDNPRFVKRSLLPMPYIAISFIIHSSWIFALMMIIIIFSVMPLQ